MPSLATLDLRTRRDLVVALHETMPAILVAGGCATGIAAIAALHTGNPWYWLWAIAHLQVMVVRLLLRRWLHATDARVQPDLWLHWYAVGGMAASSLVGLGGVLMFVDSAPLVRAVIPISCFAISAGATARNSSFPRLAFAQICVMLLPLSIESFLECTIEHTIFGVLVLAGLYAMTTIMRDSFRQTLRLLQSQQRQEALIAKLEQQTAAAQAAADAKDRFLHEMSHELRTPLNAIIGFSEAIALQALGPITDVRNQARYLGYAGDVNDSGRHLLSLVNRVLDVASCERRAETVSWRDIDCADLLHGVGRMLAPLAEEAQVELHLFAADGLPRFISDELRLRQILLNLAGNAIRFTPTAGSVTVRIEAMPSRDALLLSVEDTGIGIAKRDLERVLEPFERAGEALHGSGQGTGLGLALTKHFVELLGGNMHLWSELGTGTRVEVRLPAIPRQR